MNRTSAVIFFLFLTVSFSHAEVITDGTLHKEGKQFNLPSSPYYNITADTGQQKGSNLFHSFLQFNIQKGETAFFSGPENISNIISRVTGGSSSLIDGLLYSNIIGADFYFLNPSGIIFGPNAYLSIPGSFHFSTADYLKLGEDGRFDTMTPENSLLTMSPPSDFGFLTESPAPISLENSRLFSAEGKSISFTGGDITIENSYLKSADISLAGKNTDIRNSTFVSENMSLTGEGMDIRNSTLLAPNGNIRIDSKASVPDTASSEKYGDITLSGGSKLLSGQDGGSSSGIFIQGGNFYLKDEGTTVFSANSSLEGGDIDILLSGSLLLQNMAEITTGTIGEKNAGNIRIHSQNIAVSGGGKIHSESSGTGNSGDIYLRTDTAIRVSNGGEIFTYTEGQGAAGNISASAVNLNVTDGGKIYSYGSGNLDFSLGGSMSLTRGAQVGLESKGQSGNIGIHAQNLSVTDSAFIANNSGGDIHAGLSGGMSVSNQGAVATNSGDIAVSAGYAETFNGGILDTGSTGSRSGNITVNARSINLSGSGGLLAVGEGNYTDAGNIDVTADTLRVSDNARISTASAGNGLGGNVLIRAGNFYLDNNGITESTAYGNGNAGNIRVETQSDTRISGSGSGLYADAKGSGNAGEISVNSELLNIWDGGLIRSLSYGKGSSGNISIQTKQTEITGVGNINSSSLGNGNSGDISVKSETDFQISGTGSGLFTEAKGNGAAGDISVHSANIRISDEGKLSTASYGDGSSGNIILEAAQLEINSILDSSSYGSGNSGDLSLIADIIRFSGSNSGLYADSHLAGNAGNIAIASEELILSDNAVISGETEGTGRGGDVIIGVKDMNISGGKITTTTWNAGDGGNICISAQNSLRISGEGNPENGLIANAASGSSGKGGSIRIFTETLTAEHSASLAAQTFGSGPGGSITANANQMNIRSNAYISTAGGGPSDGGEIRLTARDSIEISDSAEVGSMSEGRGNAGNIHLSSHSLLVSDEGRISSDTKGKGNAGNIRINADGVEIRKGHILSATENADSGNAGDIFITADSLSVSGSGLSEKPALPYGIHAKSQGAGQGGNIHISARLLDVFSDGWISSQTDGRGRGGDIFAEVNRLNVHEGGTLTTSTRGSGNSGNISISANQSVNVSGAGSYMEKSSIYTATHSAGSGGILTIRTPFLRVGEDGELFADTLGDETLDGNTLADGPAGDIFLYTDFLELSDGAVISAGTQSEERGGNISVYAEKGVQISGGESEKSGIYALSESQGKGGNITLKTLPLKIEKGGEISTSASDIGSAGTIDLKINDLELAGSIRSHSTGEGKAGNIRIDASEHIISEGGEISTASEKSRGGSISIDTPFLSALENSRISAAVFGGDKDGGQIDIRSEILRFTEGSRVESSTGGKGKGGEIRIYASDSLYLTGKGENNTGIFSTAGAEGDAGRISVRSPFLFIENHAQISTESAGSGKAGDIYLEEDIRQLSLRSNGEISSANLSDGDGGSISIRTEESVTLENSAVSTESAQGMGGIVRISSPILDASENSRISAGVSGGEKPGGSIDIRADRFALGSGSRVESSTRGKGEGGTVTVNAVDSLRLSGSGEKNTGIFSTAGAEGNAGKITVRTPDIFITDNAQISTESTGAGKAGDIYLTEDIEKIEIRNRGTLSSANSADGDAGSIFLSPAEYLFLDNAFVSTDAAEGKGGEIRISTPLLKAGENSRISAGVSAGMKEGGSIDIHSQNMEFTGGARAESSTGGEGRGGTITLTVSDSLLLSGKGEENTGIFSMTDDKGSAGQIRIQSPEFIMDNTAAVRTDTSGSGTGGNMDIAAENLRMEGESSLSSRSTGDGNAGDITVRISDEVHMNNSSVTTEAQQADGGNIRFLADGRVNLTDSNITASVGGGQGNGGNIEMDYGLAILEHSRIIAKAEGGTGGNIRFTGDDFIRSGNSIIDASSRFGIDGSVNFVSPEADISGNLAVFPENFLMASQWLQTPCRNKSMEDVSRFLLSGRDGVPTAPDDRLASPIFPLETKEEPESGIFTKARHFLSAGDFRNLLKESEKIARMKDISERISVQAILYQAWAYQSLGFHEKALSLLYETPETVAPGLKALIFGSIGDLHLCLGNTAEAGKFLKKAMEAAEISGNSRIKASVLNHMGNYLAAIEDKKGAMSTYTKAFDLTDRKESVLCPVLLLNLARLALEQENVRDSVRWLEKSGTQIRSLPDSFEKAFYLLSLSALSLDIYRKYPEIRPSVKEMTASALQQSLKLAEKIPDSRLVSYACGYMGRFYEMEKEYDTALRLTRKAVFRAGEADCPEILYLWQWQAGRLFQARKNSEKAMDAYNSAISELTPLRAEFYTGFRRKKEIFNKKIRPLYLDRVSLLLQYAEKISDSVKQQVLFRETLDTLESMKTTEIQDYFQDECMTAIGEKSEDANQADKGTALIYPFITEGHPVLLLSLSGNIRYIKVQADSQTITSHAKRLRRLLERKEDTDKRPLRYAKYLYEQLIRPLENLLSASGIDTLVIVPEGALRLIPFSALHDGRQFLIEKYAIATVPAASVISPNPGDRGKKRTLVSGLSESRQGFPALPKVPEEVMNIQKITDGNVLQNRNFTLENLSGALRNTEYSLIHMATHAQFGSSPEKTFLLTYDGKITPDSLEKLIGLGIFRDNPVDLLTLSACQTAAEDERAILGLAGTALKSGAGSSLSTLWYVDDEAGSVLLTEFYRQLIQKNMSKAKALQQAQIKLIGHSSFHHPMYWSPFLLIGNRL